MNTPEKNDLMRLNRFLARCGIGSRRQVEDIIAAGRITVNDVVTTELATRIKPGVDKVTLDGSELSLPQNIYYKCYKPRGVVTTMEDTHGRPSISDLMNKFEIQPGVVPAGRLDMDSEGLLILTKQKQININLLMARRHPMRIFIILRRLLLDSSRSWDSIDRIFTLLKANSGLPRSTIFGNWQLMLGALSWVMLRFWMELIL